MEPHGPKTQHAICMTCERVITRRYLSSEWGAWLHDINTRSGRISRAIAHVPTRHAAIPREVEPNSHVDPWDETQIGDWSAHGRIGPTPTDRHCPDCGAEVTMAGRQCPRCTDQTVAELDR